MHTIRMCEKPHGPRARRSESEPPAKRPATTSNLRVGLAQLNIAGRAMQTAIILSMLARVYLAVALFLAIAWWYVRKWGAKQEKSDQ
jgi:hypothetical protein